MPGAAAACTQGQSSQGSTGAAAAASTSIKIQTDCRGRCPCSQDMRVAHTHVKLSLNDTKTMLREAKIELGDRAHQIFRLQLQLHNEQREQADTRDLLRESQQRDQRQQEIIRDLQDENEQQQRTNDRMQQQNDEMKQRLSELERLR